MKALLDTHAVLWMCGDSKRISPAATAAILNSRNKLYCSVVSWWEIAIKVGLGKLDLSADWASSIKRELRHNGVEWLALTPDHCERLPRLPFHHRDPFDRMLIAQAEAEGLSVLTADSQFAPYGIPVIW
jgi:PIN domain nuclease of toxin-antitoxin system